MCGRTACTLSPDAVLNCTGAQRWKCRNQRNRYCSLKEKEQGKVDSKTPSVKIEDAIKKEEIKTEENGDHELSDIGEYTWPSYNKGPRTFFPCLVASNNPFYRDYPKDRVKGEGEDSGLQQNLKVEKMIDIKDEKGSKHVPGDFRKASEIEIKKERTHEEEERIALETPASAAAAAAGTCFQDDDFDMIVAPMRWGLVPRYSTETHLNDIKTINAREDRLTTSSLWEKLVHRKRCCVVVDGYFEWPTVGLQQKKAPYFIRFPNNRPMYLAGLFDVWRSKNEGMKNTDEYDILYTFSIITLDALPKLADIHIRMPAILQTVEDVKMWLNPQRSFQNVQPLLHKFCNQEPHALLLEQVSTLVNNIKNDSPDCILPEAESKRKGMQMLFGPSSMNQVSSKKPKFETSEGDNRGVTRTEATTIKTEPQAEDFDSKPQPHITATKSWVCSHCTFENECDSIGGGGCANPGIRGKTQVCEMCGNEKGSDVPSNDTDSNVSGASLTTPSASSSSSPSSSSITSRSATRSPPSPPSSPLQHKRKRDAISGKSSGKSPQKPVGVPSITNFFAPAKKPKLEKGEEEG